MLADLTDVPDVKEPLAVIREHLKPAVEEIRGVVESLKLDLVVGLQSHDVATIRLRRMLEKFRRWLEAPELLSKWVAYSVLRREIESLGMAQLAAEIDTGATRADEAVARFELAYFEEVMRDVLRRTDPSLEHFFVGSEAEPFFVKNLENIQGDERDVIFISVGYGKDSSGYMAMNFGPLSNDGGERRLNVLITRARDCCCVYSSIRADDIDLNRARSRGAQALKTFLKYAESGLLDTGTHHGAEHDSEFERQVAEALRSHGYQVHPQVGVAGFFIDLAVVDPEKPGRYLLGIECDGANYHRSRWARDRDRLRQAVLEDRGWLIHRVWSTDWFHRPESELRRLLAAIDRAKVSVAARQRNRDAAPAATRVADKPLTITRVENDGIESRAPAACVAEPYVVASFRVEVDAEIHELPPAELARVVARVIEIEGPIHGNEIARRVTQLCGLRRTGRRIREAVTRALQTLPKPTFRRLDGDFYMAAGRRHCPVRDRSTVEPSTIRKPEMLPPVEIRKALRAIVEVNLGVEPDEAIVEAARLFGFRSTSAQLRQVIEREMAALVSTGRLERRNGKLYVCDRATAAPRRSGAAQSTA